LRGQYGSTRSDPDPKLHELQRDRADTRVGELDGAGALRITRASLSSGTSVGKGAAARSRLSFDAHQRSVLAAYPVRRLNTSARSPLARHAVTRSSQVSVVVLASVIAATMRHGVGDL
jgi:hypothetical protein